MLKNRLLSSFILLSVIQIAPAHEQAKSARSNSPSVQETAATLIAAPATALTSEKISQPESWIPEAPGGPASLPTTRKIIGSQNILSPLDPYIPVKQVQKIIAGYCTQWVPYRVFQHENLNNKFTIDTGMAFSPIEETLTALGHGECTTWNIRTKQLLNKTKIRIRKAVFSPDGNYLTVEGNGALSMLNLQNHKITKLFDKLQSIIFCIDHASNNQTMAIGMHDKILLVNLADKKYRKIEIKGFCANKIVFSPDGSYLAALLKPWGNNRDGKPVARIWDINKSTRKISSTETGRTDAGTRSTATSTSSRDAGTSSVDVSHQILNYRGCGIYFTPDSKKFIISATDLLIYDIETNKLTEHNTGYTDAIANCSFSTNGFAVSCTPRELTITDQNFNALQAIATKETYQDVVDLATNKPVAMPCAKEDITGAVFSPNGTYLAVGTDSMITVWKNNAEELVQPTDDQYEENNEQEVVAPGTHKPEIPSITIAR